MGYYPNACGHRMKRSKPDDHLLFYCVDGSGLVNHGDERSQVTAGDVVLLRQGVPHEYAADTKAPWSLYWLHFQGVRATEFCEHVNGGGEQPIVHVGVLPALIALFNTILAARHTGYSSLSFIHAANQIRQLFTHIAIDAQTPTGHQGALDLSLIQAFMRENLHRSLDLDMLAHVAGLSKFHFSHRYRLATGYPPMRHLTHMKMEAACRLLDTTDHSIQHIASTLSFDDPLYFSRAFRRVIGCSPRHYRASSLG